MSREIYMIGADSGKTVVAAGLMHLLIKSGHQATSVKPAASGVSLSAPGQE